MARQNNYPIFENNSTVITAEFLNGLVNNVKTLNQEDGVFDISIANAVSGVPTTYNSLELALSGTSIPVDVRKGGMAVKFINSTTNKYEQWNLKTSSWSTDTSDWQGVDDELIAGSDNLVKSGGVVEYSNDKIFSKLGLEVKPSEFLFGYVAAWGGPNIGNIGNNENYDCVIVPATESGIIFNNFKSSYVTNVAINAILYSGIPSHETFIELSNYSQIVQRKLSSNVKYVVFNFNHAEQAVYETDGFYISSDAIYANKTLSLENKEKLNNLESRVVPIQTIKNKCINKTGYYTNANNIKLCIYDVKNIRETNVIFKVAYSNWNVLCYAIVNELSDIPSDSSSATLDNIINYRDSGGQDGSIHEFVLNIPANANYVICSLGTNDTPSVVFENRLKVDCYGDSHTDGGKWEDRLQILLGEKFHVRNFGIGGQASESIAYRAGGKLWKIGTSFQIPSGKTKVQVNLVSYMGGPSITNMNLSNNHSNINPVYINRVKGYLSISNNTVKFNRDADGVSMSVSSGALVYPHSCQDRGDIAIIWMGSNDNIHNATNVSYIKSLIADCVNTVLNDKYIVIGLQTIHSDRGETLQDVLDFNSYLKTTYGNKFIDVLDYMSQYGLAGLGLTPTQEDEEYMSRGEIPPQLLRDGVHYTDDASFFLGGYIYDAIIQNGYLGNNKG